eukprot:TRINITY_DN12405_c0_g1_i6.p1 TRINITY_DN12405_c0_g1~~TRINITY_DN12405_c0_g1_i6.p1  ORF type:complete len:203 (-),score=30.82 TRINITY_DN12405_c0_g1_i6:135-743(-)
MVGKAIRAKSSLLGSQTSEPKSQHTEQAKGDSTPLSLKVLNSIKVSLLSTGTQIQIPEPSSASSGKPFRNSRRRFCTRASSSQSNTRPVTAHANLNTSMNQVMEIRSFLEDGERSKSSKGSRRKVLLSRGSARYNYSYKSIHKGCAHRTILLAKKMPTTGNETDLLKITGTRPINAMKIADQDIRKAIPSKRFARTSLNIHK